MQAIMGGAHLTGQEWVHLTSPYDILPEINASHDYRKREPAMIYLMKTRGRIQVDGKAANAMVVKTFKNTSIKNF